MHAANGHTAASKGKGSCDFHAIKKRVVFSTNRKNKSIFLSAYKIEYPNLFLITSIVQNSVYLEK